MLAVKLRTILMKKKASAFLITVPLHGRSSPGFQGEREGLRIAERTENLR